MMFGNLKEKETCWEAVTGQGVFRVLRPGAWEAEFGRTPCPAGLGGEAAGVAVDIAVAEPAAAARFLAEQAVATCATVRGPAVADVAACGNAVIRFVPAR